jgi:hypothetical protein
MVMIRRAQRVSNQLTLSNTGGESMKGFIHVLGVVILAVGGVTGIVADDLVLAQEAPPFQTLKGQLFAIQFAIQGEVYVLRDVTGRFLRVRVDKDTKKVRPLVTGEKIEVQVSRNGRALSIMPTE